MKKLFIANRGEIAARIALSAKKLGVETATIIKGDTSPRFLDGLIDHWIKVEDDSSATYLDEDLMISLAQAADCDAVHPGFGFLSEKASFAEKIEKSGLTWVGPSYKSIEQMASKAEAREIAASAGVPLVPGLENITSNEQITELGKSAGYPLLIKAALGGGGKGMRVVEKEEEIVAAIERASSEALNSFGDDKIIVEKYIQNPRHVEVQVLADKHGTVAILGDRDCSVQRRHQKIVEEAPATNIHPATRIKMHEAAKMLAEKVNYVSAGTVEFLLDASVDESKEQQFYFLEMNTRLQVEHPVTEMIFSIDLVAWQLRIAEGAKLTEDVLNATPKGHSVEVRLYAEDCLDNFFPAPGKIDFFRPSKKYNARWEVGLDRIDVISPNFDPMIAKAISYEETRVGAIESLSKILEDTIIAGTHNNKEFLIEILSREDFKKRPLGTPWLAKNLEVIQASLISKKNYLDEKYMSLAEELIALDSSSSSYSSDLNKRTAGVFSKRNTLDNSKLGLNLLSSETIEEPYLLNYKSFLDANYKKVDFIQSKSKSGIDAYIQVDGLILHKENKEVSLNSFAKTTDSGSLLAPVPGKLIQVLYAEGSEVKKGQTIMILESMKMEFEVKSSKDGIIEKILVEEGMQVDADTLLASFEK